MAIKDYDKSIESQVKTFSFSSVISNAMVSANLSNPQIYDLMPLINRVVPELEKFKVSTYSHCCGIVELHGWACGTQNAYMVFAGILYDFYNTYIRNYYNMFDNKTHDKLVQVVVRHDQNLPVIGKILLIDVLKVLGFKEVRTFKNTSGNQITILHALGSEISPTPIMRQIRSLSYSNFAHFSEEINKMDWSV